MSKHEQRITGARLNARWAVGAAHALYIHDGHWYHKLQRFPGALFDQHGYILFRSEAEFRSCRYLRIGKDVSVPKPGISAIPGYVRVVSPARSQILPPEELSDLSFSEGAVQRISVNRYERDERARGACLAHYGARCIVCGFDFGRVYGPAVAGFIHVHHLTPLAAIGEKYEIDPVEDLRPVCANCHAVAHRREPPYSVDEVRDMIRAASEGVG